MNTRKIKVQVLMGENEAACFNHINNLYELDINKKKDLKENGFLNDISVEEEQNIKKQLKYKTALFKKKELLYEFLYKK
jgi:hypothetical protein